MLQTSKLLRKRQLFYLGGLVQSKVLVEEECD